MWVWGCGDDSNGAGLSLGDITSKIYIKGKNGSLFRDLCKIGWERKAWAFTECDCTDYKTLKNKLICKMLLCVKFRLKKFMLDNLCHSEKNDVTLIPILL